MSGNSIGKLFTVTTFGESHGPALGGVVDGCPPGLPLDPAVIQAQLDLGLDAYVTATSPIRKYFDLVTQRQIRAALGLEQSYTSEEIDRLIQLLEVPMSQVPRIQSGRHRYWLLKYLEQRIGEKEEAIVLKKQRNCYQILLSNYMIECDLPISGGFVLKPEDLIQVTIQNVRAREEQIVVYIG